MVPFVVVDLGPDSSAERMAWVLEACTSAIRNGRCVAEPPDEESPGAVAIVRVRDTEGRVVRIEVGRRRDERALWSVREMEFAQDDPADERWRSVGLALATLVGEIEEAEAELQDEPPPETPAQTSPQEEPDLGTPAREEPEPAASADMERATAEAREAEPLPRPRTFIGVGALAGRGSDAELRWGGGLRGAWLFDSGLQLAIAADYSALDVSPTLAVDWLRFSSGAGYRHFVSDRWSFGFTLRAGVRSLGTVAEVDGQSHSRRKWSFLVAGSADVWWQMARFGGVWLELELATIGRTTRLLDQNREVESTVPFGDAAGTLGLWFSL